MNSTQLKINGMYVEGLDDASVKITINNISPVTMTGDSVAFSATIKVPKTPNNDEIFRGLNKGLLSCDFYDAELLIRSIPFSYSGADSSKFYAKVSASSTEYTINLIESAEKWSDVSRPISTLPKFEQVKDGAVTVDAADLSKLIRDYFTFPQNDLPAVNPQYPEGGLFPAPDGAERMRPSVACARGQVTWDDNVATGSTKIVPKGYAKGRGGYVYPSPAAAVLENAQIYMYGSYFYDSSGGSNFGFMLNAGENQQFRMIVEFLGDTIPDAKPPIQLAGVISNYGRALSYYGKLTDRIWIYNSQAGASLTIYPKRDPYLKLRATIGGVTRDDYFKFPDGFSPEELIQCGAGTIVNDPAMRPTYNAVSPVALDFPYSDVKNVVEDLCSAFHWRKTYRDGTLAIEPIVNPAIRDKTPERINYLVDWSDKFVSLETTEVPDEFGDQYTCTLGEAVFSYSNGRGTINPVKEAYKSSMKYTNNIRIWPYVMLTDVFNGGTRLNAFTHLRDVYYPYIQRHFKMFRDRVGVKIKARVDFPEIQGLKLDVAYYFSQLNGYFYLKSLGEYNVETGECKLSLYKLNLT